MAKAKPRGARRDPKRAKGAKAAPAAAPAKRASKRASERKVAAPAKKPRAKRSRAPDDLVASVQREEIVDRFAETRNAARAAAVASPDAPPTPGSRGKYVYCIVRSSEYLRFGPLGMGAEPSNVHTINYRDLGAVVSDAPAGVLDPTREHVLAHQRVNETVMRDHTVIPMSFGTVFKTRDDIIELLRSAYEAFSDVLAKMQDKLEFGLKVLWDRDEVIREIEEEDEDVRRLKAEISAQRGSTYFARMQYGRLVDAALQARSERYSAEIFGALQAVSVARRTNKPIGDKMILNAAFLVARDQEAAFDARVRDVGARHDKLTFNYTGPWPPYNFVNIRLKLERAR